MNRIIRIFLCVVLIVCMLLVFETKVKADESKVYYGDVNNDGVIDLKDVTALRRYLAGGWNITTNEGKADVNRDGSVDPKDVTMLRRYLVGGWGLVLPENPVPDVDLIDNFDDTVEIGEISFPLYSSWNAYMAPSDQGNGVYLAAYLTSDVSVYLYESVAVPEEVFNEATSSKTNFEYVCRLFVDELAKQAGATNPKIEIFDEAGITFCKSIGTGNIEGLNMSYATYIKLQENHVIITMTMERTTCISEESDAIAFEACKLAKKNENIGNIDEEGNIIITENDGAIIYKYNPDGVLLSKTVISNGCKHEYYYDNTGKLIAERITEYDGSVWNFEYEYDEQGNKSKYTQVNSDGSRYEHIYDTNGREIKYIQKWPSGDGSYKIGHESIFEYNEKNQKIKVIENEFYGNRTETYIQEYEYNDYGAETKKAVTTPEGYTAILEQVYDENSGRVIKIIATDSDGSVHEYPFIFDENGRRLQYAYQPGSRVENGIFMFQILVCEVGKFGYNDVETSYIGGKMDWKMENIFDDSGKLIRRRITESNGTIVESELNSEGKWVEISRYTPTT